MPSGRSEPIKVALPEEPPEPQALRVQVDLVEAAQWFVEHVQIPPQRGTTKGKERDRYRCQNPECGRISLRNEAHHMVMRSHGGSDSPENLVTVCRACHLRGLHAGEGHLGPIGVQRVEVATEAWARLWTYPGGRATLQLVEPLLG